MNIKDMRRGDWMPGDVKPEAPGVWERDYTELNSGCGGPRPYNDGPFCKFDGEMWYAGEANPEDAARSNFLTCDQNLPWRGQLEYDPHNAPPGFVADPAITAYGLGACRGCEYWPRINGCEPYESASKNPCVGVLRPDGRSVIMKRAKP